MKCFVAAFLGIAGLAVGQTLTVTPPSPVSLTIFLDTQNPSPAFSQPILIATTPSPLTGFISPIILGPAGTGQWLQFAVVPSQSSDCSSTNNYVGFPGMSVTTPAYICVEAVQTSPSLLKGDYFGSLQITFGSAQTNLGVALSVFPSGYLQLTDPFGTSFDGGSGQTISFPLVAGQPQPTVFVNVWADNNGVVCNPGDPGCNNAIATLDLFTRMDDGSPAPWIMYTLTDPATGTPTLTSPAELNISINPAQIPLGQSLVSGKIFLSSEGMYQGTDYVQVTTTAPTLSVSAVSVKPQSLSFSYRQGGTLPLPQSIQIDSNPEGFQFSAQSNANWVGISPSSGTTPATVQVGIDPTNLPLGNSMAQVTITVGSAAAILALSVNVTGASTGNYFVPMSPCRAVDTRNANGPLGGPSIGGGTSRTFAISGSACEIPSTATAYSLNFAVVPHGSLGYATVWPAGESQPLVSILNSPDGRIKANAAIVPAGSNGAISVYATDTTDVFMDINGYFVPEGTTGALAFYPLTPCRIADTRTAAGTFGGPSLTAGGNRSFPILSSPCSVPSKAQAYSLNFTAAPSGSLAYLTVWPSGRAQPNASALNDFVGSTIANAVIVPGGSGDAVSVFATDNTDLIIDINGYFAPPGSGGLALYTMQPCRIIDTRQPPGSPPFQSMIAVNVSGSPCSVPSSAQAYVLNATVVPPGFLGFLTLWPHGETQPLASTLNATDGELTSNMAIVPTTDGSIDAFASELTQLVLDIFGYFAP
jgi:hypothetical protein